MKSTLFALAALVSIVSFSTVSNARSPVHLQKIIASVAGNESNLTGASLLEDGTLQIGDINGKVKIVQLSKQATDKLVFLAAALEGAKLTESTTAVTCRMMVPGTLSQLFVGTPQTLTLTNQDCTVEHKVQPKETELMIRARELRTAITTLALANI